MICHDDRMSAQPDSPTAATFYDAIGGAETFTRLVHRFLRGASHRTRAAHDVSPQDTTLGWGEDRGCGCSIEGSTGAGRALTGGAGTPAAAAPRALRRDPAGRDRGLHHMRVALDELELPAAPPTKRFWDYCFLGAQPVNTFEEGGEPRAVRRDRWRPSRARRGGGADAVITRSTCAASPTPTATAKETWPGVRYRAGALVRLGVDAVWLTPFYPSPMADGGYDVARLP